MKVTVWGINYKPELIGISVYNTEMCQFLSSAGHEVSMVTGFPYYPTWKLQSKDVFCLYRKELDQGVEIHRCRQYVPAAPTVLGRILHELSFAFTSAIRLLTLPSPDLLIVIGPPMIVGLVSWLVSLIKRVPVIQHIQDLQLEAAVSLGMLKPGTFVRFLAAIERFSYAKSHRVSSISPNMCQSLRELGVPAHKIGLFPNWVELPDQLMLPQPGTWKAKYGIDSSKRIVSYAGTLGIKQGWDLVFEAAAQVNNDLNILFVVAGNGGNEAKCKSLCAERGITNVLFLDLLSSEDHTALLVDSDICVIPQKPGSSKAFLPSKLLKILALGRPVVTNCDEDSALHDAVLDGQFGIAVSPNNPGRLAAAIDMLLRDDLLRQELGDAGRHYVRQFERSKVLQAFESTLDLQPIQSTLAIHANRSF